MKKIILSVVCGALTMLLASSCGHDDGDDLAAPEEQTTDAEQSAVVSESVAKVWHVTLKAKTASNGISKALTGDYDGGFNGQFAKGEKVYVFKVETEGYSEVGELTAESTGTTTTFNGDFKSPVAVGDNLELRYLSPNFDYSGQDGTLAKACEHFYAIANVQVTAVTADGEATNEVSLEDATFEFCSSMVKFTLTEKAVTSFTISDGKNTIAVTPASATNELYVSLPPVDAKTDYTIVASDGKINFSVTKSYEIDANKYYSANVTFFKVLSGVFSVSNGKTVKFAAGNLRYNADNGAWSFARNQYDFIRNAEGNESNTSGTRDLFGWGTWVGNGDPMTTTAIEATSSYGYSGDTKIGAEWETLSHDEWVYLLGNSEKRSGKNGFATIHSKFGLIVLPDNYTDPKGVEKAFVSGTSTTEYSDADWSLMESAGAVFLPAAGYRDNLTVYVGDYRGNYWSKTSYNASQAYNVYYRADVYPNDKNNLGRGQSVRLVRNAE